MIKNSRQRPIFIRSENDLHDADRRSFANASIDSVPASVANEEWADELVRVLKRATATDPAQRQQSVEDLWIDLAGIRQIAADGEYSTMMRFADRHAAAARFSRLHADRTGTAEL
ncbi:MAG: hypothetical protein IPG22_20035 [Acidobacteria bacterium]|nr:hypothetical protein [Acidobacteriota bacterium]